MKNQVITHGHFHVEFVGANVCSSFFMNVRNCFYYVSNCTKIYLSVVLKMYQCFEKIVRKMSSFSHC